MQTGVFKKEYIVQDTHMNTTQANKQPQQQ